MAGAVDDLGYLGCFTGGFTTGFKMEFLKKIAIDLGTVNCICSVLGSGVFASEPTVVAVSVLDNKVLAIGKKAKEMLGRTPEEIKAQKPLKDGVIADYRVTEALLKYYVRTALGSVRLFKPEFMISAPVGLSSIERAAVLDAAVAAGARRVYLFPEPLAAALGAGIPVGEPSGSMIINIGGGTSEIAVVSLGGIVVSETSKVAGNKIDKAIESFIKHKYSLLIGEQTAEKVKMDIGSAVVSDGKAFLNVKGRSTTMQTPSIVKVTGQDICDAIQPVLLEMVHSIGKVLEKIPPELSSDVLDKGAVLSGGSALLKDLDKYLTLKLGVPVHKADDPINCVARGLLIAFADLEVFEKNLVGKR
jgi:rod shape-determining protein MreB